MQNFFSELRQTKREERKTQKPWRKNMKSVESQEKEIDEKPPEAVISSENDISVKNCQNNNLENKPSTICQGTQVSVETIGTEGQETQEKPWRQNMQKDSISKQKGMCK